MSKFEAELRLPCKQPYAYISVWVRGETDEELYKALEKVEASLTEKLTTVHQHAYDIVMGVKKPIKPEPQAQALIESELGGKILEEKPVEAKAAVTAAVEGQKPWERPKPATKAKADPNDPFASFK